MGATAVRDRRREPLSRERIVCAARDYIDRECLADLSMRKLGTELGVEAMSLYRYFPSKAELLRAIVDRVAAGLHLPEADTQWREAVRRFARSFRAIGREHPRIFPLLASSPAGQPAMRRATEALASSLRAAGFDEASVAPAQCAVIGFVMGSTLWQLGEDQSDEADFEFGLEVLLAGLDAKLGAPAAALRG